MIETHKITHIAVFRALQLGDMLVAIPALRALRKNFNDAKISLISLPWAKDFSKRFSSYIDTFITFPGYPGLPEQSVNPKSTLAFLEKVQKMNFDLAIQMQGDGTIVNSMIELFGAKQTAGFYSKNAYCPDQNTYMMYPQGIPEVKRHLKLMRFLGLKSAGDELEFPLTSDEKINARMLMHSLSLKKGGYVILHPGARDIKRRWSLTKFAEIGRYILSQNLGVVITGSKDERLLTYKLSKQIKNKVIDLGGKTSLSDLAYIIKNCRLVISNSTGVAHIADALNVPSIVIFQASDPVRWGPLDSKLHRIVRKNEAVKTGNVIVEIDQLLRKKYLHSN